MPKLFQSKATLPFAKSSRINYFITGLHVENGVKKMGAAVGSTHRLFSRADNYESTIRKKNGSIRYKFYVENNVRPVFITLACYNGYNCGLIEIGETVWSIILGTIMHSSVSGSILSSTALD